MNGLPTVPLDGPLQYKDGYKIMTYNDISIQTNIRPDNIIIYKPNRTIYISLTTKGVLTVYAGYGSDLASGPTINTKSSRRGAVFHDALYELMRQGLLDIKWREKADRVLYITTIKDDMWQWRAKLWYKGLQIADGKAAKTENKKKNGEGLASALPYRLELPLRIGIVKD